MDKIFSHKVALSWEVQSTWTFWVKCWQILHASNYVVVFPEVQETEWECSIIPVIFFEQEEHFWNTDLFLCVKRQLTKNTFLKAAAKGEI